MAKFYVAITIEHTVTDGEVTKTMFGAYCRHLVTGKEREIAPRFTSRKGIVLHVQELARAAGVDKDEIQLALLDKVTYINE
jgi:hypothetical protein